MRSLDPAARRVIFPPVVESIRLQLRLGAGSAWNIARVERPLRGHRARGADNGGGFGRRRPSGHLCGRLFPGLGGGERRNPGVLSTDNRRSSRK